MGLSSEKRSISNLYVYEGPEGQIHGAFEELLEVLGNNLGKRRNYKEKKEKRTFEYNPKERPGYALLTLTPFLRMEDIHGRFLEMRLDIREDIASADLEGSFLHNLRKTMEDLRLRYGLKRTEVK